MADNNGESSDKLLNKSVGTFDVLFFAIGALIGFAVFMLPGDYFLSRGGPVGSWLGIIVGALIFYFIAANYGYLIRKYPVAGGSFIYTLIAFKGPHRKEHAFVTAWCLLISYWALLCINVVGSGLVLRYIFPGVFSGPLLYSVAGWDVYLGELIISLIVATVFGWLTVKGMKTAAWVQNAVTVIMLLSVAALLIMVLVDGVDFNNFSPAFPEGKSGGDAFLAILALSAFWYMGFDVIPQSAEEYKFTPKKAFHLILIAIASLCIVTCIITFITASVEPWQQEVAAGHYWSIGYAVEMILGRPGLLILGVAMMCGIFSGVNAFYATSSRIMLAMGRADAMPHAFAKLDAKNGTPRNALIFIMLTVLVMPFFGRQVVSWIVDMISVAMAVAYMYTSLAAAKTATANGDKKEKVFGWIGVGISIFFLCLLLIPGAPAFLSTPSWIMLVVWTLIGLSFYLAKRKDFKASDKIFELVEAVELRNAESGDADAKEVIKEEDIEGAATTSSPQTE